MNRITCLTFSLNPFERELPKGCSYVNQNSKFNDEIGFQEAMVNGVNQVTTEDIFICDSDDPLPLSLPEFNTGLIYGDFFFTDIKKGKPNVNHVLVSGDWERDLHLNKWYHIHKPIMKTKYVKKVLQYIEPHSYMHVQHAVHYLIAMLYGSTYQKSFIASWNKHETGLHTVHQQHKVQYTKTWLLKNRDRIYKELTNLS